MADQVKNASSGVQDQAKGVTKDTPVAGVQDKIQSGTNTLLSSIGSITSTVAAKGQALVDSLFPPEKRAAFLAKLQAFMLSNPKLSAFLGMNLLLTGIPLGLFILFSISVFIFALVVALIIALLGAVLFTVFCVGVALFIVLPAIMFTTFAATFLFLWGLGGYHLLRWANGDSNSGGEQAPEGSAIGDKLNSLTGGRLSGFMEDARGQNAKKGIEGYGDRFNKPAEGGKKSKGDGDNATTTGSNAKSNQQQVGASTARANNASVKNVERTAANAGGTVSQAAKPLSYAKGGLSGASGVKLG